MLANDPRLMLKSEIYVAKLMELVSVIKVASHATTQFPTLINKLNSHEADFTNKSLLIASLSNDVCHFMAITWEEVAKSLYNLVSLKSCITRIKE